MSYPTYHATVRPRYLFSHASSQVDSFGTKKNKWEVSTESLYLGDANFLSKNLPECPVPRYFLIFVQAETQELGQ